MIIIKNQGRIRSHFPRKWFGCSCAHAKLTFAVKPVDLRFIFIMMASTSHEEDSPVPPIVTHHFGRLGLRPTTRTTSRTSTWRKTSSPGGRPGPDNQGQAQRGEEKGPGARRGRRRRRGGSRRGGGGGGPRPENLGESEAELGSAGIAWYPILEDGLAEAKLSNKPIFFMAVASQCGGISGVF